MHELPAGFTDADLSAALRQHWHLPLASTQYLPVGFGGFHWLATDRSGARWFATASRLAGDSDFSDLSATMGMAVALAARGLDFVVAPVRSAAGQPAVRVRPDWAVTLYGYADGTPGSWGDTLTAADRAAVVGMLAAVHAVPAPPAGLPVRSLDLPGRTVLAASLRDRRQRWHGGPFAEPARALVAGHAAGLAAVLERFAALTVRVAAAGSAPVVTHGEPHAGNLVRRAAGLLLIDWDTAGLALPERDLWWVLSASGEEASRYQHLTGRPVNAAAAELYRLRWDLDDICLYLADFRGRHARTRDTEVAFAGLADAIGRLAGDPDTGILPSLSL